MGLYIILLLGALIVWGYIFHNWGTFVFYYTSINNNVFCFLYFQGATSGQSSCALPPWQRPYQLPNQDTLFPEGQTTFSQSSKMQPPSATATMPPCSTVLRLERAQSAPIPSTRMDTGFDSGAFDTSMLDNPVSGNTPAQSPDTSAQSQDSFSKLLGGFTSEDK